MKIRILYVEGCPSLRPAQQIMEQVLAEYGVTCPVESQLVSEATVTRTGSFAGSPTILINGRDVEPATATGMACRIYSNGTGCPSLETVRRALERAHREEPSCNEAEP